MKTITIKVPNISCAHCVHTISTELAELPGVSSVVGDEERKFVTVSFDAPASQDKIEARLAEIDYPAEKLLSL